MIYSVQPLLTKILGLAFWLFLLKVLGFILVYRSAIF